MCELNGIRSNQPTGWDNALTLFRKRGGETADNHDGWSDDKSWEVFQSGELRLYQDGGLIGSLQTEPVRAEIVSDSTNRLKLTA